MVDPLSYSSFQPMIGVIEAIIIMCYPIYGMVHIKERLPNVPAALILVTLKHNPSHDHGHKTNPKPNPKTLTLIYKA